MAGQWTPNEKQRKLQRKQAAIAARQRELVKIGSHWNRPNIPGQLIGKPGGTGAGKKLATPLLPVMRRSVIG
jgi:hypothetical protein